MTEPNDEELGELGTIDKNNPFALATSSRNETIVDAKVLQQKMIAFPLKGYRVMKAAMNGLVIGTRARILGGISLPKRFD